MKKNSAFSLLELSIVLIIVAILIAGTVLANKIVRSARLATAQTLTQNSPVKETPNLFLWYETSLPSSFIPSETLDNAAISAWYDNSSQLVNRNNAVQSVAGNKPLFVENVFNGGIPALRFDGTDDFMTFDGSPLVASNYTIFVVEQRRSNKVDNNFIGGTSLATNTMLSLGYITNTTMRLGHFGGDSLDFTVDAYNAPIQRIHTFRSSSTGGKGYWSNGGGAASEAAGGAGLVTPLVSFPGSAIGRYNTVYFNGDIAEIIMFNRALKTSERQAIEIYLSKKYDLPIS